MSYCPECGIEIHSHDHETDPVAVLPDYGTRDADVEIARIESAKAIALAKIQANTYQDEVVVEAIVAAAAAEGEAEGLREALAPEVEDTEPIVIVNDNTDENADDELEVPDAETHHESAPKRAGLGLW